MDARLYFQTTILLIHIDQGDPDRHLQNALRLLGGKNGILMEDHIRIGQLGPDMRNGVATDFRTDKCLDQVDEVAVAQKLIGAVPTGRADIGATINLVAFVSKAGQAAFKWLAFIQTRNLALLI